MTITLIILGILALLNEIILGDYPLNMLFIAITILSAILGCILLLKGRYIIATRVIFVIIFLMVLSTLIVKKQRDLNFTFQIILYFTLPVVFTYLFATSSKDTIIITILSFSLIIILCFLKVITQVEGIALNTALQRVFIGLLLYTVVIWIINRIKLINKKTIDEYKVKYLNGILAAGINASELTKKLLAFGRKERNIIQSVQVNKVVTDLHSLLVRSIDKADNIYFELDLEKNLFTIDADPAQIH